MSSARSSWLFVAINNLFHWTYCAIVGGRPFSRLRTVHGLEFSTWPLCHTSRPNIVSRLSLALAAAQMHECTLNHVVPNLHTHTTSRLISIDNLIWTSAHEKRKNCFCSSFRKKHSFYSSLWPNRIIVIDWKGVQFQRQVLLWTNKLNFVPVHHSQTLGWHLRSRNRCWWAMPFFWAHKHFPLQALLARHHAHWNSRHRQSPNHHSEWLSVPRTEPTE